MPDTFEESKTLCLIPIPNYIITHFDLNVNLFVNISKNTVYFQKVMNFNTFELEWEVLIFLSVKKWAS